MGSANKQIDILDQDDSFRHFDDFFYYNDAEMFTLVKDASTTIADSDAHGGILVFTTAATDNDEGYVSTTQAVALPINNKPAECVAKLQFTDLASNAGNVIFGFSSTGAADTLQNNGAGPPASYSGAVFFKPDSSADGDKWHVECSNGSTQSTTKTKHTAGGAGYAKLHVGIQPISSTLAEVIYRFNGEQCRDVNGDTIKHSLSLTSLAALKVVMGMKTGAATAFTVNFDYVAWVAKR